MPVDRRGLAAVLAFAAVTLLLFCALDRRPPDDHDDFYTGDVTWSLTDLDEAPLFARPGVVLRHFARGELHPQLAQTSLLATLATFGRSRFVFRAANLPFYLLLIVGTWLLARQLASERLAILAAFATANLPMMINYSRKWDIQFHAACLAPLGLALGIAALRSEGVKSRRLWIAFGAWQGLRLYTHPIVVPDIVATAGLLLAASWLQGREAGKPLKPRLVNQALSAVTTGLVGLYYLGFAGRLIGEPGYSMRMYLVHRGSYGETTWWQQADLLARGNHVYQLLSETVWFHVMPLFTVLLLPGLLLAPWVLLRKRLWQGGEPGRRWLLAVVAGTAVAQLPLAVLGTSNRAFLNDWLFVAPYAIVTSLVCLRVAATRLTDGGGRAARAWGIAIVVAGLAHHAVPLTVRAAGHDPVAEPEAWESRALTPFVRSTSGRHYTTHHVPMRSPIAGTELARRAAELGEDRSKPGRFVLVDLTFDPSRAGERGCHLGSPDDPDAWAWRAPSSLNVWAREVSPWPFVFEGFRTVRTVRPDHDLNRDASNWSVERPAHLERIERAVVVDGDVTLPMVGGEEERRAEQQAELQRDDATARLLVVRLWVELAPFWQEELYRCHPDERLPDGFFDAADRWASHRFPDARSTGPLPDPTGWLVARAVEWDRTRSYLGVALTYVLDGPTDRGRTLPAPSAPAGDEVQLEGEVDDAVEPLVEPPADGEVTPPEPIVPD